MNTDLPDFLIVGASKCGTTALASYLAQNKQTFITEPKEPKYLSYKFLKDAYKGPGDNYTLKKCVKTLSDYKNLFKSAPRETIKGEASVDMLFHYKDVIPQIKQIVGDPKIIIMLREPSKRAFSAYSHLVRDERETYTFEEGLEKEEQRLNGDYEFIWAYKTEGFYYEPVKAYLENFSKVKIVFFEDFIKNELATVNSVLKFLGANSVKELKSISQNKSGQPKSKFINRFFLRDNIFKSILKGAMPQSLRNKLKTEIQERNLKKIDKNPETLESLRKEFAQHNQKLFKLLSKEQTIWN